MAQNKQFKADHGDPFNADAVTIMHGEGNMIIDFKQTTPRLDQVDDDQQHTIITEHNAVVMRPEMAKALLNLLEQNVSTYEEQFGELDLPEQSQETEESADAHNYIG